MQNDPFSELFGILNQEMAGKTKKAMDGAWLGGELGTMTDDLGLKLDRYKHIIRDYMISHHLTLAEPDMTITETDGEHSQPDAGYGGAHSHKVITPIQLLPLHPGDRVLAIPVNGGQDFVITARVVPRE